MASSPTARPPAALFACPSLSHLERLPPSVFAIVAQHVCFQDRFTTLSRLSQHVPPLTPACFHHEHLIWAPRDISLLVKHPTLFPLLLHCAGLRFVEQDRLASVAAHPNNVTLATLTAACGSLSGPRPLGPLFPRLKQLSIEIAHQSQLLESLFPSSSVFPALTALQLAVLSRDDWWIWDWPIPASPSFLSPLNRLHALRELTLQWLPLSFAALRFLCTLPLTSLDLSWCELTMSPSEHAADAVSEQAEGGTCSNNTWETVLLPRIRGPHTLDELNRARERTAVDCIVAALLAYCASCTTHRTATETWTTGQHTALAHYQSTASMAPLRYLAYNGLYMPSVLECAARMACLVTLDLDAASADVPFIDFSPLFHPTSLVPRLPHLLHFRAPRTMAVPDRNWPSEVTRPFVEQYLDLLTAYRSQLQLLSVVTIPYPPFLTVFDHTLVMPQLRSLTLCCNGGKDLFGPLPAHPLMSPLPAPTLLPNLHTLHLSRLPLTDDAVVSLFLCCPALEDCYIHDVLYVTLDLLPLLSTISSKLRSLRIDVEQPDMFLRVPIITRPSTPAFPRLAVLSIACSSPVIPAHFEPATIASLAELLQTAPVLERLYLSVDLPVQLVHLFSSLQRLVGLQMWQHSNETIPRVGMEVVEEQYQHRRRVNGEVMTDTELMSDWWHPLRFVAERIYDGMNGREAFFHAVAKAVEWGAEPLSVDFD